MKKIATLFCLACSLQSFCQSHNDTVQLIQRTAALYDLNFTEAEADSMMINLTAWKRIYVRMHQQLPKNSLAFPFAFNPAPAGFKIPTTQQKINWVIPANVSLPANRNELAFYSILQLASLIKNKK